MNSSIIYRISHRNFSYITVSKLKHKTLIARSPQKLNDTINKVKILHLIGY